LAFGIVPLALSLSVIFSLLSSPLGPLPSVQHGQPPVAHRRPDDQHHGQNAHVENGLRVCVGCEPHDTLGLGRHFWGSQVRAQHKGGEGEGQKPLENIFKL